MSAREQDQIRSLAERIANRLAQSSQPEATSSRAVRDSLNSTDELAALRAGLSEIQERLTQIESRVTNAPRSPERTRETPDQQPSQIRSVPDDRNHSSAQASDNPPRWLSGTYVPAVHPSEERFGIGEAVSELVEFFEREKVCNVEPGEKPCDHCGMCSARGF